MAAPKLIQKPEDIEWEANARNEFKASQNKRAPKPVQKPEDIAYEANARNKFQDEVQRGVDLPGLYGGVPNDTAGQFKKGGSVGSASKRADGCAQRGKTKGKMR